MLSAISNNNDASGKLQSSNYKEVLLRVMLDYENERRKNNDPYFDVYRFTADYLGYSVGVLRKFFNKYDRTGIKLGSDDLLKMCFLFKSDLPLLALHNDYKSLLGVAEIKQDALDIKDNALTLVKEIGDVAGAVQVALSDDNMIDDKDRQSIGKEIIEAEEKLETLKKKVGLKK